MYVRAPLGSLFPPQKVLISAVCFSSYLLVRRAGFLARPIMHPQRQRPWPLAGAGLSAANLVVATPRSKQVHSSGHITPTVSPSPRFMCGVDQKSRAV